MIKKYIQYSIQTIFLLFIIYFTFTESKDNRQCIEKCRAFCNMCTIGAFNKHTPEWTVCYW